MNPLNGIFVQPDTGIRNQPGIQKSGIVVARQLNRNLRNTLPAAG